MYNLNINPFEEEEENDFDIEDFILFINDYVKLKRYKPKTNELLIAS